MTSRARRERVDGDQQERRWIHAAAAAESLLSSSREELVPSLLPRSGPVNQSPSDLTAALSARRAPSTRPQPCCAPSTTATAGRDFSLLMHIMSELRAAASLPYVLQTYSLARGRTLIAPSMASTLMHASSRGLLLPTGTWQDGPPPLRSCSRVPFLSVCRFVGSYKNAADAQW